MNATEYIPLWRSLEVRQVQASRACSISVTLEPSLGLVNATIHPAMMTNSRNIFFHKKKVVRTPSNFGTAPLMCIRYFMSIANVSIPIGGGSFPVKSTAVLRPSALTPPLPTAAVPIPLPAPARSWLLMWGPSSVLAECHVLPPATLPGASSSSRRRVSDARWRVSTSRWCVMVSSFRCSWQSIFSLILDRLASTVSMDSRLLSAIYLYFT